MTSAAGSRIEWLVIDPDNPTGTLKRARSEEAAWKFVDDRIGDGIPVDEDGMLTFQIGKLITASIRPLERKWWEVRQLGVGAAFWWQSRVFLIVERAGESYSCCEPHGDYRLVAGDVRGIQVDVVQFGDWEARCGRMIEEAGGVWEG